MTTAGALHDAEPEEIISILGMKPHPEGGHFIETFRDNEPEGHRGNSSAICYLLQRDEISAWHRIDSVEVWHWYAGDTLSLSFCQENDSVKHRILGPNLRLNQRPQIMVPRFAWQKAYSLGAWTLVGCTVSPAFEFDGFEMAPKDWTPNK